MPDRVHHLTVWPHWHALLASGTKTHEIRRTADRDFRPGDLLRLTMTPAPPVPAHEDPFGACDGCGEPIDYCPYAGRHAPLWFRVLHVRHGDGEHGIMRGFAVLSLERITAPHDE